MQTPTHTQWLVRHGPRNSPGCTHWACQHWRMRKDLSGWCDIAHRHTTTTRTTLRLVTWCPYWSSMGEREIWRERMTKERQRTISMGSLQECACFGTSEHVCQWVSNLVSHTTCEPLPYSLSPFARYSPPHSGMNTFAFIKQMVARPLLTRTHDCFLTVTSFSDLPGDRWPFDTRTNKPTPPCTHRHTGTNINTGGEKLEREFGRCGERKRDSACTRQRGKCCQSVLFGFT